MKHRLAPAPSLDRVIGPCSFNLGAAAETSSGGWGILVVEDLVLRKYQHRRFYDSRRSRFLRLSEIAELVRAGASVSARDRDGKDISSELMARVIIHEQSKTKAGPLTTESMRMLIRFVGGKEPNGLALYLGSLAAFLELLPTTPTASESDRSDSIPARL